MEGVTKLYGDFPGIEDVNLVVHPGETVVLVGPNGAGKTTILHMCAGIVTPTRGSISVLGYTWGGDRPYHSHLWRMRRDLGFIHADLPATYRVTGREYLSFHAALHRIPRQEARTAVEKWLAFLGLTKAADRVLETYSHGMLKKVQVAAALIHRPKLVICDEPTSGLDPEVIAMMRELFRILSVQQTALLIATHDLSFSERIADRFALVHRARIASSGTLAELKREYQAESLEEAFLKAIGATQWKDELRELLAYSAP